MRICPRVFFLCLLMMGCSGLSRMEQEKSKIIPISKAAFISAPFSFDPVYKVFLSRNEGLLSTEMITLPNAQDSSLTDTFYHASNKLADIYFLHDTKKNHPLFTADIMLPDIKLFTQSIRPGLTRTEFFWRFTDWASEPGDTLSVLSTPSGYKFSFIFTKEVLTEILIEPSE